MKSILIIVLAMLTIGTVSAQKRFGLTDGVQLSEMGNQKYVQFDENASKYFWAINLNSFTSNQKTTFQELVFKDDLLIACSTPDVHNIWYLSSFKTNAKELVTTELEKLITKAQTLVTNTQDKYQ